MKSKSQNPKSNMYQNVPNAPESSVRAYYYYQKWRELVILLNKKRTEAAFRRRRVDQ